MAEGQHCPQCGAALAPAAAQGLCPRCLIALNLAAPTAAPTGCTADGEGEPAGGVAPSAAPAPAELAADFPELEILELLGKGGMGAVYKARQRRLGRLVALKILPPTVSHKASFAERFTREAQALARLNHPHIVTLYEFGQANRLFYFLMEYVDGMNLRQLLSRLTPKEALAIVPQVCDALQYAHEQGIVHRDIKPENLLLSKQGILKIADFGVAKLLAEGLEESTPGTSAPTPENGLTERRGTLGTPQYMAPEQVAHPLEVDHRADIYSLGVVLYQMLTGQLPTGQLEPPSRKASVDVRLDQVVLRALEKQPERRYQHASEIKSDVETIARTGGGGSGSPPAPPPQARGRLGKRMAVVVAAALSLAAGLGVWHWSRAAKVQPQRQARLHVPGTWERLSPASLLKGRGGNTLIWTGREVIVFGGEGLGVTFGDGARYSFATDTWTPLPLEGATPSARTLSSAIWTGEEMILWGGFGGSYGEDVNRNDGARFNPTNDVWRVVSTRNAPSARFAHTAVWSGKEMLVWGGYTDSHAIYYGAHTEGQLDTGGCYDPAADSWRPITTRGAPTKRYAHVAVWTGREMIIWAGGNATQALNDGARYDPSTDTWTPISTKGAPCPRVVPQAVWTGQEMIVWGGCARDLEAHGAHFQDGARYNPQTDTWRPLSLEGAPLGRSAIRAVWTGTEMMLWGGVNDAQSQSFTDPKRYLGQGARYDPVTDRWMPLPTLGAPSPRLASTVWTDHGLFLFGGYNNKHLNDAYCLWLTP